ncbi:polyadenylate-binding protein-interacting protein 9-like protein [Tanacetum coccineum]
MGSMASGSQVSVEAKQSDTLHAFVANPGSQGASSGSSSELNTQSVSELMASLNLNPLAKDFVPSSNLRINPNQGLNHLARPDHQMYPGMEIQGHPNHGSTWRNHYNNESQEVRYRTRRTVFVSSIDNNVTEEQLAELFSNQGKVMDCRICGNPYSTLRFAFIEFADQNSAQAALNLSGVKLGISKIRVMRSKTAILPVNPSYVPQSEDEVEKCARTVCCTNIDNQVSRAELKYFFETSCGEVSVMRHLRDGIHATSMAFIEFVTRACRGIGKVVPEVGGVQFGDKQILVGNTDDNDEITRQSNDCLLSEEPLASFYSHIRCAASSGEGEQASPAYLPSISIGGNDKSWQLLAVGDEQEQGLPKVEGQAKALTEG